MVCYKLVHCEPLQPRVHGEPLCPEGRVGDHLGCFVLEHLQLLDLSDITTSKQRQAVDQHTIEHAKCDLISHVEWKYILKTVEAY